MPNKPSVFMVRKDINVRWKQGSVRFPRTKSMFMFPISTGKAPDLIHLECYKT